MDLDTVTLPPPSSPPSLPLPVRRVLARGLGLLTAVLAAVAARLLADPASVSDLPDVRMPVYPLTTLPLIVAVAAAGITAVLLPSTARPAAVIGTLAGLQVAGIAVVASRDWYNYAGAGNSSYGQAAAGSQVSLTLAATAAAAVLACLLLYRHGPGPDTQLLARPLRIAAGLACVAGVPLLLCVLLGGAAASVAGVFALYWSLPLGAGIIASGSLRTSVARRAAALGVAGSVLLTVAWLAFAGLR